MTLNFKTNFLRLFVLTIFTLIFQQTMATGYYPNGFFVNAGAVASQMVATGISITPKTGNTLEHNSISDHGVGFVAAAGYKFGIIPLAVDIEYTNRPSMNDEVLRGVIGDSDENLITKLNNVTTMFNLFYDIHIGNDYFVPFVMGGAGFSKNKGDVTATLYDTPETTVKASKTLTSFAWQAGGGIHVKLTNNIFISPFYRYAQLGKVQWGPWVNTAGYTAARTMKTNDFSSNEGGVTIEIFFGNQQIPKGAPSLLDD